jgi:hypothetical protein
MPTVKELQAALRKEGMATDGKKAVLEARLAQAGRRGELAAAAAGADGAVSSAVKAAPKKGKKRSAEADPEVLRLLDRLVSKKRAERLHALKELSRYNVDVVVPHADKIAATLVDLETGVHRTDECRNVQRKAVGLLSNLGPGVGGYVPAIVQMFRRQHIGWPATLALRKLGSEVVGPHVAEIVKLLTHLQPEVREVALRALRNLGQAAQPAADAIVARLADSSGRVRNEAFGAVQTLGSAAFIGTAAAVARHIVAPVFSNPSPYGGGGFEADEQPDENTQVVVRLALRLLIKMTIATQPENCWKFCNDGGGSSEESEEDESMPAANRRHACNCNDGTLVEAGISLETFSQAIVSAGALPALIDIMRIPNNEHEWDGADVEAAVALTMTLCSCTCVNTAARAAFEDVGGLIALVWVVEHAPHTNPFDYEVSCGDRLHFWTGVGDASAKGCAAMALFNFVERPAAGSGIVKHAGTRHEGDGREDLGLFVSRSAAKHVIAAGTPRTRYRYRYITSGFR